MKNNKGFTLIELLVVVAIIGILAAVGTIAYSGYTASAQKNASKTIHAQAVKYLTAETQKCILDKLAEAMDGSVDCDSTEDTDKPSASNFADAYVSNDKNTNPYGSGDSSTSADEAGDVEGTLYLVADDDAKSITLTMTTATTGGEELTSVVEW